MPDTPRSPTRLTPEEEPALDPLEALRALLVIQERMVSDRLSGLLARAEGHAAAERALGGIVLDTLGERDELEDIVIQWAAREGARLPPARASPDFRDLVQSLLDVKRSAARRYRRAALAAPDRSLRERLERLARQAGEHAAILLGILGALDVEEPASR